MTQMSITLLNDLKENMHEINENIGSLTGGVEIIKMEVLGLKNVISEK